MKKRKKHKLYNFNEEDSELLQISAYLDPWSENDTLFNAICRMTEDHDRDDEENEP